jgi:hypothetical protein
MATLGRRLPKSAFRPKHNSLNHFGPIIVSLAKGVLVIPANAGRAKLQG